MKSETGKGTAFTTLLPPALDARKGLRASHEVGGTSPGSGTAPESRLTPRLGQFAQSRANAPGFVVSDTG